MHTQHWSKTEDVSVIHTCTQYTTSSKQRACRTTLFSNTFIVCTQKVFLYNIDNIDPHRGCYTYICVPSVQQAANSELAKQQYLTTLPLYDCLHTKGVVVQHWRTHRVLYIYTQYTTSSKQRLATFLQRKEQSGQVLGATLPPTTNFCVNIFFFDTIFSIWYSIQYLIFHIQ